MSVYQEKVSVSSGHFEFMEKFLLILNKLLLFLVFNFLIFEIQLYFFPPFPALFTARSPVLNHFSTTMLGLPTIRAFHVQDKFFELFTEAQDIHTETYYTFVSSTGWLCFNLDLISGLLVIFCSFVTVAFSESK